MYSCTKILYFRNKLFTQNSRLRIQQIIIASNSQNKPDKKI